MNIVAKEGLKSKLFGSKGYVRRELWQPLVVPAIVILVGLSAFALGRLSALGQQPLSPVILNQ